MTALPPRPADRGAGRALPAAGHRPAAGRLARRGVGAPLRGLDGGGRRGRAGRHGPARRASRPPGWPSPGRAGTALTSLGSVSLISDDELAGYEHLAPWLASLYVVPAARGRGLGRRLVDVVGPPRPRPRRPSAAPLHGRPGGLLRGARLAHGRPADRAGPRGGDHVLGHGPPHPPPGARLALAGRPRRRHRLQLPAPRGHARRPRPAGHTAGTRPAPRRRGGLVGPPRHHARRLVQRRAGGGRRPRRAAGRRRRRGRRGRARRAGRGPSAGRHRPASGRRAGGGGGPGRADPGRRIARRPAAPGRGLDPWRGREPGRRAGGGARHRPDLQPVRADRDLRGRPRPPDHRRAGTPRADPPGRRGRPHREPRPGPTDVARRARAAGGAGPPRPQRRGPHGARRLAAGHLREPLRRPARRPLPALPGRALPPPGRGPDAGRQPQPRGGGAGR